MLEGWLFSLLDALFFWLFWLPPNVSLVIVSLVSGLLLIFLYWLTSDQWRMAFEKERIKRAQNLLLRGDYSVGNVSDLLVGNLRLTGAALVPAIVTIAVLLCLLPWVGNRFGYRAPAVGEPVGITVTSGREVSLESPGDVRQTRLTVPGEQSTRFRVKGLSAGRYELTLSGSNGPVSTFNLIIGTMLPPKWPNISRRRWYHRLVKPAGTVLETNSPIRSVRVDYPSSYTVLGFHFFGTYVPGWLSFYFLVSFVTGLYVKFRYSVE